MWERESSPVNSDNAFCTCSVLEFLYFLSLFWLAALSCAKTQQSHQNFWPCHDLSSWIQEGDHLIITKTLNNTHANCRPHWLIRTHHLWKEVNLHLLPNPNSPFNVSNNQVLCGTKYKQYVGFAPFGFSFIIFLNMCPGGKRRYYETQWWLCSW